jgi:ATP synthase F1 complex assembly factor 2
MVRRAMNPHQRISRVHSYHQSEPEQLVRLQQDHWYPLLEWSREHLGADVKLFDSVLIGAQPEESKTKLLSIVANFDQWQMAGG